MKKSTLKNIIKEATSEMEVSLKLSNGKIIHGKARTNPKALSLQIGSNTYFSFWEGKFILSGTGSVTIVEGVDDYSQEWFLKATEEYLKAMHDTYPERFGPYNENINESTPTDAFMAGWNQSKANLGKGKIKGDVRDIDAWMEYSQGKGSEEEKDAFIYGWFKARTTTDYQDVEMKMFDLARSGKRNTPEYDKLIKRRAELEKVKMNESTSRTIIINSTEEWEDLANNLKGYKYRGSLKPVNPNRGLIQLSNYAKYPYEVMIDDKAKIIEFGEHSLKENKMTKRDIICIINEEVENALNEMYDPIYDSMIPEILAMLAAGGLGIKAAIKYLKEKGLDKQAIIDIINKAKSKLNELKATNKGKDITKHLNDYLEGKINKSEFEELTGLKKESINEANLGDKLWPEDSEKPDGQAIKKLLEPYRKALMASKSSRMGKGDFDIAVKDYILDFMPELVKDKRDLVRDFKDHLVTMSLWKKPINENEGMTKSLKDIDPNLSLTKFDTTPPSFKVTYRAKNDMSKEMEEELVAWVLSKGGNVEEVSTEFELDDDRYNYPNVYFKF